VVERSSTRHVDAVAFRVVSVGNGLEDEPEHVQADHKSVDEQQHDLRDEEPRQHPEGRRRL
jgi:hypothetical protein